MLKYCIAEEKQKIKNHFLFFIVLPILCFIVLISDGLIFICSDISVSPERDFLVWILSALTAIAIFVMTIPGIKDVFDYPFNKRRIIVLYLSWFIIIIILLILQIANLISTSSFWYRTNLTLFIYTLLFIIPYIFMFIHSDKHSLLISFYYKASRLFIRDTVHLNESKVDHIIKKITIITQLIIQSLHDHDNKIFSTGLKKLSSLGHIIVASTNSKDRYHVNKLIKNIVTAYRYIAEESIQNKSEEDLNEISINMSSFIQDIIESKQEVAYHLDYAYFVREMKKTIILLIIHDPNFNATEMIDYLGRLCESSLKNQKTQEFDNPPDTEILLTLEEIGIFSSKKQLENLVIEILVRIKSIALTARDEEDVKITENNLYREALRCYFLVSSFFIHYIPEAVSWMLTEIAEFGIDYKDAYNEARKYLNNTSFISENILSKYKELVISD